MNDDEEEQIEQNEENGIVRRNLDKVKEKADKEAHNTARKEAMKKIGKEAATKGKLATALGPIIFWVIVVIVIIIVVVGIIMFFLTMPGMVMDKLKSIAKTLIEQVKIASGNDKTKEVTNEQIYSSLDYLEEMGYDLKGFGFLTDYIENEKDGVKRNEEGKISEATSDFITTYLISDNYIYTLKNDNLVTNKWWEKLLQNAGRKLFGLSFSEKLTRGLIAVYKENGTFIRGGLYTDAGWANRDVMKLDVSSKKLILKKGGKLFQGDNNQMEYNLDGWTGRYGMPIDFLVSIHVATMMPDLAYDMSSHFDTNVILLLHTVRDSEVQTAYKESESATPITRESLKSLSNVDWELFNTGTFSDGEAEAAIKELGITVPDGMSAKDFLNTVMKYLNKSADIHFDYYIPYLESVRNHWYRDVYYVINSSTEKENKKITGNSSFGFIKYDYDYEKLTKERWTLYETDDNNNFKLYALNDKGQYIKVGDEEAANLDSNLFKEENGYYLFTGSQEEQKSALQGKEGLERYNVSKMPITVSAEDENILDDLGWNNETGIWAAYKTNGGASTGWEKLNPSVTTGIESKIYSRITGTTSIQQTGEGQRGETNPDIKKMFLYNTYFRYDGSTSKAEIITALRKKIKSEIGNDGDEYGPLNELKVKNNKTEDYTGKSYTASELGLDSAEGQEGQTYAIKDYSGQVTLNQDSLNAFSMLENTHTLDSDYIYRDFKELVVELGYFEKEELTEDEPRLLEFIVPNIGSHNYPNRLIDKREAEYGTMIHSKGDIDAITELSLAKMIEKLEDEKEEDEEEGEDYDVPEVEPEEENVFQIEGVNYYYDSDGNLHLSEQQDPEAKLPQKGDIVWISEGEEYIYNGDGTFTFHANAGDLDEDDEDDPYDEGFGDSDDFDDFDDSDEEYEFSDYEVKPDYDDFYAELGDSDVTDLLDDNDRSLSRLKEVGSKVSGFDPESVTVEITADEFIAKAKEMHKNVETNGFEYCNGGKHRSNGYNYDTGTFSGTKTCRHNSHQRYTTYEEALAGEKTTDCSSYVCWVMQSAGIVPKTFHTNSQGLIDTFKGTSYLLEREAAGELQPGDILLMGTKGVNGHAQINGEDNIQYCCGGDPCIKRTPKKGSCSGFLKKYEYVLRFFDTEDPDDYVGYLGNDQVVSPVTGILLEYGVYNKGDREGKDIDSISGDEYRVNVDLKYGPMSGTDEKFVAQKISDKVGYAKILVLDKENYQKIENTLIEKSTQLFKDEVKEVGGSLLSENGQYKDIPDLANKKMEKITEKTSKYNNYDKTIYGYKEFAESYEEAGIAGYIIYIDGFINEIPDPKFTADDIKKKVPYEGDDSTRKKNTLTLEESDTGISFKSVKLEDLEKGSKTKKLDSKYFKDKKYKFVSESETNKYKTECNLKNNAYSSVYFQYNNEDGTTDDLIVLKEGTVIGRTMTDKELLEDENIRKDKMMYKPNAESEAQEEVTFKIAREGAVKDNPIVIGNYLRIIMRDLDTTPVENVEDYMKLDPDKKQEIGNIEKLMTWQALEVEGFHFYAIPGFRGR